MGDIRITPSRKVGRLHRGLPGGGLFCPKWHSPRQHPASCHHHHLRNGFLLGFLLVTVTCLCASGLLLVCNAHSKTILGLLRTCLGFKPPDPALEEVHYRGGLYAAVLTSGPSLDRARAIGASWGKGVSNLTFFVDGHLMEEPGTPFVKIPVDSPSPKEADNLKMFYTLQHICTFGDEDWTKFDWFLISRDDVFVNIKLLSATIRRLESKDKVQAGFPSAHSSNDLVVCSSTPAILLSRRLAQDTCRYLSRCQREASRYGPHLAVSSCVYHYSGVQCTPLPPTDFYQLSQRDVKDLMEEDRDRMSLLGRRLDQVTFTQEVSQPGLMLQLHAFSIWSRFKEKGKALEKYMETKASMESYVYVSYAGPYHHVSTSGDVIYTSSGQTFSSQSCGGSSNHGPQNAQLLQSSIAILESINTDPMRSTNFTVQQIYAANIDNKTMASLIDLRVSSRVGKKGAYKNVSELARVALTMRYLPLRITNKQTFSKLSQLWILLPVQYLKELLSILKFWTDIKESRIGIAINLLLLPVRLDSIQVAGLVPKQGIYNSEGEIRRITVFPRAMTSENEAYSEGIAHVSKSQQDHAIFMTSPNIRFRPRFLRRCLAVVSTGNQYHPIPYAETHIPDVSIYKQLKLEEEEVMDIEMNHTLWFQSNPHLKCFSSMSSEGIGNKETISASDPDLLSLSQLGAK